MTRAEALNLGWVLDGLEIRNRRADDVDVGIPKCLGDRDARFVTNEHFLAFLRQS
jgi:hypothetical protein